MGTGSKAGNALNDTPSIGKVWRVPRSAAQTRCIVSKGAEEALQARRRHAGR